MIKYDVESDHFATWLCLPGDVSKDPVVGLDGTKPPPMYVFKNKMSLANSKIRPTWTLREGQEQSKLE
jgi:hypothetical protein